FDKRLARGDNRGALFLQVIRRTVILLCLGWTLGGFPNWRLAAPYIGMIAGLGIFFTDNLAITKPMLWFRRILGGLIILGSIIWWGADFGYYNSDASGKYLRVPGVLPRIALCYFFAS